MSQESNSEVPASQPSDGSEPSHACDTALQSTATILSAAAQTAEVDGIGTHCIVLRLDGQRPRLISVDPSGIFMLRRVLTELGIERPKSTRHADISALCDRLVGCALSLTTLESLPPFRVPDHEILSADGIAERSANGGTAWLERDNLRALARLGMRDRPALELTYRQIMQAGGRRVRDLERLVDREIRAMGAARYPDLMLGKDGRPLANEHNVTLVMSRDERITFDEFTWTVTFNDEEWTDSHDVEYASWLQLDHDIPATSMLVAQCVKSPRIRRRHQVRDYLDSLQWDDVPRLHMLPELFKVESTPLTVAYWRCWMIAAVRRVRNPGIKFDCMLVLQGDEGWLKSSGLRALAGPWFADTGLDIRDIKSTVEKLQGVWIYEWAELDGMTKADVTRVKSMLSSQSDKVRLAYERRAKSYPRQSVFCGTTNEPEFLNSERGDRRMWCMTVTGRIDVPQIAQLRDQLWAEAAAIAATNEPHWLPSELERSASDDREKFRVKDPWEDKIRDLLTWEDPENGISTADVLSRLGVATEHAHKGHTMRVGRLLRKLGWGDVHGRDRRYHPTSENWDAAVAAYKMPDRDKPSRPPTEDERNEDAAARGMFGA